MFIIRGLVTEENTGAGIADLTVSACDRDLLFDDLLGETQTDADGQFEIVYDADRFQSLFDRQPDIYLIIKAPDGGELLTTAPNVRFSAGREEFFDIELPADATPGNGGGGIAEPIEFAGPLPIADGFVDLAFRTDDPNAAGIPEQGLTRDEVLSFVPDDLRAAVLEEGLVVDVAAFHPALLPATVVLKDGEVTRPDLVLDGDGDGVFERAIAAYRPDLEVVPFSLDAYRRAARAKVGSAAGVERFYDALEHLIREAIADCRRKAAGLQPIDCSTEQAALDAAQNALAAAQAQVPLAQQALDEARARRKRLRQAFERFTRAISAPSGASEVTIGGVTLGFSSAAAANRVLTAWNDEIGGYIRAFNRLDREIDRLEAELDAANDAVDRARQAVDRARQALDACQRRATRRQREIEDCLRRCAELEGLLEQARRERDAVRRQLEEERRRQEEERRREAERQRQAAEEERRRRQQQPPPADPPTPPLPPTGPVLDEPQELDGLQIRNGFYSVIRGLIFQGDPSEPCPFNCWAAIANGTAIATELISKLGWDLIGTFASFLPGSGPFATLFKAFVESLAKFQSSDSLSEGARRAVANLLGGKLLGDRLGELAGTSINNLTSDAFTGIVGGWFQEDGVRMFEVEGEARSRVGPRRVCKARIRFFYNPKTGIVFALARCACCPGLFVFSYRADKNGFPVGRVTRRILR